VLWLCLLLSILCGKNECAAQPQTNHAVGVSADDTSPQSAGAGLPMNFERRTGDLDEMIKRQSIRALVLYNRSGFFYVDGKPEGIYYETLQYFERFLNQKLQTRQHVQVTFIPVRPEQASTRRSHPNRTDCHRAGSAGAGKIFRKLFRGIRTSGLDQNLGGNF
jgi:hypothetical protein